MAFSILNCFFIVRITLTVPLFDCYFKSEMPLNFTKSLPLLALISML
jgi:hypothetical protein